MLPIPRIALGGLLAATLAGCGEPAPAPPPAQKPAAVQLPGADFRADAGQGQRLFETHCLTCHGAGGRGTDRGPPLVHRIYEPAHHSDLAFYLAVSRGVVAHHWNFGDMPPVAGVGPEETAHIIAYIRAEQRAAGIF